MTLILHPTAALARKAEAGRLSQLIRNGQSPSRFRELLERGADPLQHDDDGDTAVHYAAGAGNAAYLRILLAQGVNPDTPNRITGKTPLVSAIMYERDRQFDMLLAAGADPGRADRMGNTPLHVAAQINDPQRVLALLEAGAPPNARNQQGQTFQRYLFMVRESVLNARTCNARQAVIGWLKHHSIPVEGN